MEMMHTPTRFRFEDNCAGCCGCGIVPDEKGDLVDGDDYDKLRDALEPMREALKQIEQRANETGTDALAWQETVFAMHKIAVAALAMLGEK